MSSLHYHCAIVTGCQQHVIVTFQTAKGETADEEQWKTIVLLHPNLAHFTFSNEFAYLVIISFYFPQSILIATISPSLLIIYVEMYVRSRNLVKICETEWRSCEGNNYSWSKIV